MMYGIEYEEFPAQIAQVAMWLIDHQMNMQISQEFGQYFVRLPLKKAAKIVHGNALQINWQSLLNTENTYDVIANHVNIFMVSEEPVAYKTVNVQAKSYEVHKDVLPQPKATIVFDYIMGNPPFIGKKEQNINQKNDVELVFKGMKGTRVLDYVTCWYIKAAQFIQHTKTKVAFVSTNSITQGEQVGVLWNILFNHYKIKIHFAHRTFKWSNEAKGNAAVHVVIIGFANFDTTNKIIYAYEHIKSEPHEIEVKNINPYLVEGKDITVENRKQPICNVPEMNYGSMPIDEGNLILTDEEREEFIKQEPILKSIIKPYTGGEEFIKNKKRWCLWLVNTEPKILANSKLLNDRISKTRKFRLSSNREATKKLADTSMLFGEIRQPSTDYIIIPKVSSEIRKYIPIGILKPNVITSGSALIIPNASLYHFGILTSTMHMAWMSNICGRMKSDYQYSASIVYNNYPFPLHPTNKQKQAVEDAAQKVLDTRAMFPKSSLANLYNPLTMPPALVKAHQQLDKAVDVCYRSQPFTTDGNRMEFLFDLYEQYTANLFATKKSKKKQ